MYPVALTGDIEKAFLMISIAEKDRDTLRFLWVDSISKSSPSVVALRFNRVVFGVSSSPFLVTATIQHHMEQYRTLDQEFVDRFLRSIYVDDVTYGANTVGEAYTLYQDSKTRLAEGGFNLRKFTTNSLVLRRMIETDEGGREDAIDIPIAEEDETYVKNTLGPEYSPLKEEQKILGLRWNFVRGEVISCSLRGFCYASDKQ